MLAQLSSAQVADWMAYAQLEPVGNPVDIEAPKQKVKRIKSDLRGFFNSMMEKQDGG